MEINNTGIAMRGEYQYETISILEEIKGIATRHNLFKIWMWRVNW